MTTELENTEYEEEIYEDFEFIIEESDDENLKMLTIYSENIENDKYYIGSEVCELLGHKNITHFIKKNVRDDNKIKFKNYTGKKEPVLDSRQILLKKEGVYELLKKNRKKLSEDTIDILIKANIDVSKIIKDIKDTKDDDDSDDSDEEDEDELTMYSYINNGYCFEYFIGLQITSLIGYTNVTQALSNVSKQNKLEFRDYPGVKKPKLDPKSILITRDGAIELLIKTRKRISSDVLYMLKEFGIDTTNRKCLTKEQQTLSAIANAFKTEKIEDQFKIGNYYLDMLFPEYRIVIECDENGHADRKPYNERERMDFVNKEFDIDDSHWIRYNPDEYDFDISKVIGRIFRLINQFKDEKAELERKVFEEKLILEQQEREKIEDELKQQRIKNALESHPKVEIEIPDIKLEMDETTARIRAPPKEWLLNKLKSHTVEEISMLFGISQKPTRKWIAEYKIDLKKIQEEKKSKVWFKEDVLAFLSEGLSYNEIKDRMSLTLSKVMELMAEITKDELLEQFKTKNQTEVAMHFNMTKHNFRKLLAKYSLDTTTLNSKLPKITKEQISSLMSNNHTVEEISSILGNKVLNIEKQIKSHNILKIPSKEELEPLLLTMSKDDIAAKYKTTRTTLRKWMKIHSLDNIRCQTVNRPIIVTQNNIQITYESMVELEKELNISHSKVGKCIKNKEEYRGFEFRYADEDESTVEEDEECEEESVSIEA